MATRPERGITYDDYLHFPEGERWEVINGEAFMVPAPNTRHQRVAGEIYYHVLHHLRQHGGGQVYVAPFDTVLSEFNVFQPDVVFMTDENLGVLTEANVWGSPSWVVEVLSSDVRRDRTLKFEQYERYGVPEYWIVDPVGNTIEMYRLEEIRYGPAEIVTPPDAARPIRPEGLSIDLSDFLRP